MTSTIKIEKVCELCGCCFIAKKTVTKYCSTRCASKAYKIRMRDQKIEGVNTVTNTKKKAIAISSNEDLDSKAFLSIAEVWILIGVARQTVYNLIDRGELEMGKFGGRTIIKRSSIENLLDKYTEPSRRDASTNEYYTTEEVEKIYHIKYGRLNQIIKQNKIPKKLIKNKLHISKAHIDKYFAKVRGDISKIKDWYSVTDLMKVYDLSRDAIYNICKAKDIPKKKDGKFILISKWHFDNLELQKAKTD